tara:strand:- start:5 stop:1267 length:1263 start_codon:yes stop_codon:yes gene_type:complete
VEKEATMCMNAGKKPDGSPVCGVMWERKFVTEHFPKTWVNGDWRKMLTKVAVDKEKALLPATLGVIEERKARKVLEEQIAQIETGIRKLYRFKSTLIHRLHHGEYKQKNNYNGRRCPDENCKGFLSNVWKCGLCEKWACKDCNHVKGTSQDSEHTCNKDDVETETLLKKDTKSCPKCQTPIYKIDGCDQMWCPECHTAFSWRTGNIETRIHNPHFFEWQRKNGGAARQVGDIPCGRDITDHQLSLYIGSKVAFLTDAISAKNVTDILRGAIHLQQVQAPKFRTDNVVVNLESRVKYLNSEIDNKAFERRVFASQKAFDKKRAISNVIEFQVQGLTDIMFRLSHTMSRVIIPVAGQEVAATESDRQRDDNLKEELSGYLRECHCLTEYSNQLLLEHSVTYGCKKYVMMLIASNKNNRNIMV